MLYEISLPNAHFGVETEDGFITDTIPNSHCFIGWSFQRLKKYVEERGGIIKEVEE